MKMGFWPSFRRKQTLKIEQQEGSTPVEPIDDLGRKSMKTMRFWLVSMIALLTLSANASAQVPEDLGTYTDWRAFRVVETTGQVVCFMATQPQSSKPDNLRRGPIWLLIAHRPGVEKSVVSFESGFPFQTNNEPIASIGNQRFAMFTKGRETAWGHPNDDGTLVNAMKRGLTVSLDSRSSRGNNINDVFSLRGFTKAFNKISEACGI